MTAQTTNPHINPHNNTADTADTAPLAGIHVLDLSRVLAGPYCTQLLADAGADVIKVEPPSGDDTRQFGPPFVDGISTYFLSVNRGKRSIAIDLKSIQGKNILYKLCAWADIVVQNFRPGVVQKLAIDYTTLKRYNSKLIYLSISGYGQQGLPQYSALPGYDLIIQGLSGMASLTGPIDSAPHKSGASIADMTAGLSAYGAITTALFARQRSGSNGQGQEIDISMLDCQLSFLSYHASSWLNAGVASPRLGNAHPSVAPYESYPTADGYLNIACGNNKQFTKLCKLLEHTEWATDRRFINNPDRVEHRNALNALITPLLLLKKRASWQKILEANNIPCGPILTVPDALNHPQIKARNMVVNSPHNKLGSFKSLASPLGVGAIASEATQLGAPTLSAHAIEILKNTLHFSPKKIAQLFNDKVIIPPHGHR